MSWPACDNSPDLFIVVPDLVPSNCRCAFLERNYFAFIMPTWSGPEEKISCLDVP